jgi:SAM-dependent methyltransferase
MKLKINEEPRKFRAGKDKKIIISDFGRIQLLPDEMVTFTNKSNQNYDIVAKNWGFYATPSLNQRLKEEGFRTALIRNPDDKFFIWLVEIGKENLFENYLKNEHQYIVCWLDNENHLNRIVDLNLNNKSDRKICICGSANLSLFHKYDDPPAGETKFDFCRKNYKRSFLRCQRCGHFLADHDYHADQFYSGDYAEKTYGDKIKQTFNRIINLPPKKSDNYHRVSRVINFFKRQIKSKKNISVLDVGSGLCVFLYLLKQRTNWNCTALDPDPNQARHAQQNCNIETFCTDFLNAEKIGSYDLICFNKVLEHFIDPITTLSKANNFLNQNGYIYLELPDGESALHDKISFLREEFFIEHYHAFSFKSVTELIDRANFLPILIERIREPSSKYTFFAFVKKKI